MQKVKLNLPTPFAIRGSHDLWGAGNAIGSAQGVLSSIAAPAKRMSVPDVQYV
jgi:hypothetical protein